MAKLNISKQSVWCWSSTLTLSLVPCTLLAQDIQPASFSLPSLKISSVVKQQGSSVQPPQPFGSGTQQVPTPSPAETASGGAGSDFLGTPTQSPRQQETVASPGTNNISTAGESSSRASTDVGDFLAGS
jgi:hypothetical protein